MSEFTAALRASWLLVAISVVLGLVGAVVATLLTTPVYSSEARLLVSVKGDSAVELAQGRDYAEQQAGTYAELASSPLVLDSVIDELGLSDSVTSLARRVSASTGLGSPIIDLTATSTDADEAAALAGQTAEALRTTVEGLESTGRTSTSPVHLVVLQEAATADSPSTPRPAFNAAVGLALGTFVGTVLAMLLRPRRVYNGRHGRFDAETAV
jgi:succinoglycan biosynthesis transport protein ExoP